MLTMLTLLVLIAAISLPPKPAQYVTDHTGVLPNRAALNEKLAAFESETSNQILVYVDQQLPPDTTIEEMGSEAMKQWGVGQKGKDNGAILFVFVADHKMRIEVGYGLESVLTDAKARNITSTVIKPAFKKGDFAGGIERGVESMLAAIREESNRGNPSAQIGQTTTQSSLHSAADSAPSPAAPNRIALAPRSIDLKIDDAGPLFAFFAIAFFPQLFLGFRLGARMTRSRRVAYVSRPILIWLALVPLALIILTLLYATVISPATVFAKLFASALFLAMSTAPGLVFGLIAGFLSRIDTRGIDAAGWTSSSSLPASSSSSWDSSSSSSSSSDSSSSSSDFSGGGGSGGGGGASDSW